MGYKFQFITLAGFHSLNYGMFNLAYGYARNNMSAFVELQEKEFAAAERGFTAVKHQREKAWHHERKAQELRDGCVPPARRPPSRPRPSRGHPHGLGAGRRARLPRPAHRPCRLGHRLHRAGAVLRGLPAAGRQ